MGYVIKKFTVKSGRLLIYFITLPTDGVAVVFYNMMNSFAQIEAGGEEITPDQIALGLVSFFTVALGGFSIGCIGGLITALITRTTTDVRGK